MKNKTKIFVDLLHREIDKLDTVYLQRCILNGCYILFFYIKTNVLNDCYIILIIFFFTFNT